MPVLREASLRHAIFYLERIRALDASYSREKSRLLDVLEKFDCEWGNFQAGYKWAKSNFPQDNKATYLCTMYPYSTTNLLPFRQNPRDRLDWNKTGLKAAQILGMSQNTGRHLAGIGLAYIALGNLNSAVNVFDRLVEFAKQNNNLQFLAAGTVNLAIAWIGLGQIEKGRDLSLFSIKLFHRLKDIDGKTRALGTLATSYASMGQHRQAIRCFEQCLKLHRKEQDVFWEAVTLVNIGMSLSSLGDYQNAVDYLNGALVIVDRVGDIAAKSRILGNLANVYLYQADYPEALICFEEALRIQINLGDQRGEAATLGNFAIIYSTTGKMDLADQFLERSRKLFQKINAKKELAILMVNLGLLNLSRGNYSLSYDLLTQGYEASISIGDRGNAANALINVGISLRHLGKLDEAIQVYNKAFVIFENLKNLRGKTFAYTNLGIIYGLKQEHYKSLEFYQLALAIDISSGDKQGEAINRVNIAGELHQLGKLEEAILQAESGLDLMDKIGDPRVQQIRRTLEDWRKAK